MAILSIVWTLWVPMAIICCLEFVNKKPVNFNICQMSGASSREPGVVQVPSVLFRNETGLFRFPSRVWFPSFPAVFIAHLWKLRLLLATIRNSENTDS